MLQTHDDFVSKATKRRAQMFWNRARLAERHFARRLRQVAGHVVKMMLDWDAKDTESLRGLRDMLGEYERGVVDRWARSVVARMIAEVSARDVKAWDTAMADMSENLGHVIRSTPIDTIMRDEFVRQVKLIRSIPGEAAMKIDQLTKIHDLTEAAVLEGQRPLSLVDEIRKIATWTGNRPNLIARTEVARTQTLITMARAKRIGSEEFVWRTAEDATVRPAHRRLDGRTFRWDEPPVAEAITKNGHGGERHLPGCFPNCRCIAIPVLKHYMPASYPKQGQTPEPYENWRE